MHHAGSECKPCSRVLGVWTLPGIGQQACRDAVSTDRLAGWVKVLGEQAGMSGSVSCRPVSLETQAGRYR